ncbi:MAG: PadR family transcriptional regulator, partial [Erysipelotrichaceae bacterium]|nr:PadR family transcriptional regulator [Erysipelotrichaceae bacterium]
MKKNRTQYVILGMLSDQAMSGYEIKKFIDLRFSFFWNESYGQLYPQLNSLEKEGSIVSTVDDSSSRHRKTYAITELGRKKLGDWLTLPVEEESVR